MLRCILITSLVICRAFLCAQEISYSRNFETIRKNVPLAIINKSKNSFYVLRYNKLAHDVVIERRAKPGAEILGFTPLRLDSVNAKWFDYENLDYLFFEHRGRVCFVFEKVLNNSRSIYIKTVDSTGRGSGFAEIAAMEREAGTLDLYYEFRQALPGRILVVATQVSYSHATRKTALLYDVHSRSIEWIRKLPIENAFTGYSAAFTCDRAGTLHYVMVKSEISGYRRRYFNHMQVMQPEFHYDSLTLLSYNAQNQLKRHPLGISNISRLNSLRLLPLDSGLLVTAHFVSSGKGSEEERVFFLNQYMEAASGKEQYAFISPLRKELAIQLEFYDGTDSRSAAGKEYSEADIRVDGQYVYQLSERKDAGFYKELILIRSDLESGIVEQQVIIPRKTFYFDGRTRFRKLGIGNTFLCRGNYICLLLENRNNATVLPAGFSYHAFARQQNTGEANVVAYIMRPDGSTEKKILLSNGDYEYVPLMNESDQCDHVFYLSRGKIERFAILQLSQL